MRLRNRPAFSWNFPRDPDLDALVDAYREGHYDAVRRGVPLLLTKSSDELTRLAARELARRLNPDPFAVSLLAAALGLLLFLAGYYWLNPQAP